MLRIRVLRIMEVQVLVVILILCTTCTQGNQSGKCPARTKNLNCANSTTGACSVDEDCASFEKCCHDGCSNSCVQSLVSGCEQTRRQARLLNTLPPSCDGVGNFEKIQCNLDGICWCVNVYGFEMGGTRVVGRDNVDCAKSNPVCSAHQCRMLCPQGFELDVNGCAICSCRDLCRDINCPDKAVCEVVELPCTDEPNCPPQPVCREGRNLDSICPFGKPLILPESGNPYLCGNGAGKPSCPPAFICQIVDGNDYGVCCTRTMNLEKEGICPVVTSVSADDDNCTSCRFDLECPDTSKCCPSLMCGKTCVLALNQTLCLQQRQLSELLTSKEEDGKGYIPQCDQNGNFVPKQCSKNGKICWCVDPEGKASVTGIGLAELVDCNPPTPSVVHKSMLPQPRLTGLKTSHERFSVNPCAVGTPALIQGTVSEVQTCTSTSSTCPASFTCVMVQVNSAGVCCSTASLTEPTKPGMCPFLSSSSHCHHNESKFCSTDKECEGDMKCCGLGASSCFGRAICADPLLMSEAEEAGDNFSMCNYLNAIGRKSHGVLKKYKMALGVPTCAENGDFEPIQCNGGNCWCVDQYGMMVGEPKNTSTDLKCTAVNENSCLGMTCKLNCDYGYVKNPFDGCNLCECRNPCNDRELLCGSESICEMVDVDCPSQMCPALPYCLPKSLIVPTCPSNKQPFIDPILLEKMTCNPRARMLQCPDDHYCHEVDDDLGLCCPVLEEEISSQALTASSRGFGNDLQNHNLYVNQQPAEDNSLDDTVVETSEGYVNPMECPEHFRSFRDCENNCANSSDCSKNSFCCAGECGKTCIDVTKIPKSNCLMSKEIGNCKAALPKWYFNVEKNSCEEFLYSGCGGNPNRFGSKESCDAFCPVMTSCERARELAKVQKTKSFNKLLQVPECDEKGQWRASCIHEVGICWCVDKYGESIKETVGKKGSIKCAGYKRNNRKSRLLSTVVPKVCPDDLLVHFCEPSLCADKICLSDPSAICRVNPCGTCTIEFYNVENGQVVNCARNLTKCELELQNVFNSKAFEIQRELAASEVDLREFTDSYLDDTVVQHREKREAEMVISEEITCPQQPIQYLLNLLSGSCTDECTLDSDCPSAYKCCLAECGLRCLQPSITLAPPIVVEEPPQPIVMLLIPPQCNKDTGEYEKVQSQNNIEYCVDEISGNPIPSTITRGTITNCSLVEAAAEEQVCVDNKQPMICRNQCLHAKCLSHPDAICVANPCDACSITFYSASGEKLNCQHKCTQPLKVGHCRASFRRYSYNATSSKCEEFIYGGCQGNDNNFNSLSECELECGASRDICEDMGRTSPSACNPHQPTFFYNIYTRSCEQASDCKAGHFNSFAQCQASCPRQVLCPVITDGKLEICDRLEACDNVTFCMDNLDNVVCRVDPCTCSARLVDLNGLSVESCLKDESRSSSYSAESKEQLGALNFNVNSKDSSPEITSIHTMTVSETVRSTMNPPLAKLIIEKSTQPPPLDVSTSSVPPPVSETTVPEIEISTTITSSNLGMDAIMTRLEQLYQEITTLALLPEHITESIQDFEKSQAGTTENVPEITLVGDEESKIFSTTPTPEPELDTQTHTTIADFFSESPSMPSEIIQKAEVESHLSPEMTIPSVPSHDDSLPTTETQPQTFEVVEEETTTYYLDNAKDNSQNQPEDSNFVSDSRSRSQEIQDSLPQADENEIDSEKEDLITEQAVATAMEFQSIFFISISVLSTLLILLGFFFARRKRRTNAQTNATKKFEPLEFNSFVALQQQIDFTKQQNNHNNNSSSNNSYKNDSTNLVIPSDSYYEQLYQNT